MTKILDKVAPYLTQIVWGMATAIVVGIFLVAGSRTDPLIRLVSVIVWPLLIAIVLWSFREKIGTLIQRKITIKYGDSQVSFEEISQLEAERIERTLQRQRKPIEFKILNTLFTKQVNKWPNFEAIWIFWIGPNSHEYMDYREAKGKLLAQHLIGEVEDSNRGIFLTRTGFDYCKQHHREFPADQWWIEEQIDTEKLQKVLKGELGPNLDANHTGSSAC